MSHMLVSQDGTEFLKSMVIMKGVLLTIFTAVTIIFITSFCYNKQRHYSLWIILCANTITYLSGVAMFAIDAWVYSKARRQMVCSGSGCVAEVNGMTVKIYVSCIAVLLYTNLIISDAIVLWRACTIYGNSKLVICLSWALLSTIVVLSVVTSVLYGIGAARAENGCTRLLPMRVNIAFVLSVLINVWTTVLMGVKTWRCRHLIRWARGQTRDNVALSYKILTLLIESGALYCLVIITFFFVTTFQDISPFGTSGYVYEALAYVSGIYPTAITVLVNLHKSVRDSIFTDNVLNHTTNECSLSVDDHVALDTLCNDVDVGSHDREKGDPGT